MRRSFTRSYTDAIGDSLRITNRARWPREHITLSHWADTMSCSPQQVLFAIFANPLRTLRSKALRPQSTQNHRKEREESHAPTQKWQALASSAIFLASLPVRLERPSPRSLDARNRATRAVKSLSLDGAHHRQHCHVRQLLRL